MGNFFMNQGHKKELGSLWYLIFLFSLTFQAQWGWLNFMWKSLFFICNFFFSLLARKIGKPWTILFRVLCPWRRQSYPKSHCKNSGTDLKLQELRKTWGPFCKLGEIFFFAGVSCKKVRRTLGRGAHSSGGGANVQIGIPLFTFSF